jgi:hypothetical protein
MAAVEKLAPAPIEEWQFIRTKYGNRATTPGEDTPSTVGFSLESILNRRHKRASSTSDHCAIDSCPYGIVWMKGMLPGRHGEGILQY